METLLRFAYRPLSSDHTSIRTRSERAEAAEAAGAQGRFWPMHARLSE
jgi:hypothetical protein